MEEENIVVPVLKCTRCGHEWYPRSPRPPRTCPACHSPYWNRPRIRNFEVGVKNKHGIWPKPKPGEEG